jgi:hypothetical protein
MPTKDHTPLIVVALCIIAVASLACATVLINKGYTAELMVGIVAGCASSLGTMLGQRRPQPGAPTNDNTTVAGDATFNLPAQPAKPQQPQPPVATT